MTTRPISGRPALVSDALLLLLLGLSLAGNVYQGLRLQASGGRAPVDAPSLTGTTLPSLTAIAQDGSPQVIRFDVDRRSTVIFAFSPSCPWCRRSWPLFKQLAAARSSEYRFIGLSLAENVGDFAADFPVYSKPEARTLDVLRLRTVPQTVLVSPAGRVEHVWLGGYAGATRNEIASFFSATLSSSTPADDR